VLYEADPSAGHVLGVDIGRDWLRLGIADLAGSVVARLDVPNKGRSATAVAQAVVAAAAEVTGAAGLQRDDVAEAVVGTPGVFDEGTGRVRYAVNLPGWGRTGLIEGMRQGLGIPLTVHNDANLAALGEYAFGAGVDSRLFVYVMIGTGLGMGVVADGELFRGAHGAAGEIGFMPSGRGTVEDAVSGDAVVRAAREFGMSGPLSAKLVFEEARLGTPAAVAAVQQEAQRLARVVASLSAVLDPDLVVLGGGVGHSADLLLNTLEQTLHELTPLRPRVGASALGEDAVLLGAIATALRLARPQVFDRRTGQASG
jgi:predicted NBD/HSP70 family sugar kinase